MITAGIDCGAQNTKCVVLRNGGILGRAMGPTGFEPARAAAAALASALQQAGTAGTALRRIGVTGSGRPALRIAAGRVAAARALVQNTDLSAHDIAEKALHIAASICVFTNDNVVVEDV